jgi:hypothetical protein
MQSPFLGYRRTAESVKHQLDHGDFNHGFAVFEEFFIIFAEPTVVTEPSERAFHNPTLGEDLKTDLVSQLAYDFQNPAAPAIEPVDQFSGITAIGPHQGDRRKRRRGLEEQQLCSVAVLDRGGMYDDCQQQPQCVD